MNPILFPSKTADPSPLQNTAAITIPTVKYRKYGKTQRKLLSCSFAAQGIYLKYFIFNYIIYPFFKHTAKFGVVKTVNNLLSNPRQFSAPPERGNTIINGFNCYLTRDLPDSIQVLSYVCLDTKLRDMLVKLTKHTADVSRKLE